MHFWEIVDTVNAFIYSKHFYCLVSNILAWILANANQTKRLWISAKSNSWSSLHLTPLVDWIAVLWLAVKAISSLIGRSLHFHLEWHTLQNSALAHIAFGWPSLIHVAGVSVNCNTLYTVLSSALSHESLFLLICTPSWIFKSIKLKMLYYSKHIYTQEQVKWLQSSFKIVF